MKRLLLLFHLYLLGYSAFAQFGGPGGNLNPTPGYDANKPYPVTYSVRWNKTNAEEGDTLELIFEGKIEEGNYTYSNKDSELGVPTAITFEPHSSYKLIGSAKAIGFKEKAIESLDTKIYIFYKKSTFIQKILVKSANLKLIGELRFAACSDVTDVCLIPKTFEFTTPKITIQKGQLTIKQIETVDSIPELSPKETKATNTESNCCCCEENKDEDPEAATTNATPKKEEDNSSLWFFLISAFAAGLVSLITPCVFPMIPMTVTFFLKSSATRKESVVKSFFYGFSIIVIYTLLGVILAKAFGVEFANVLSTHWIPNVIFTLVFILFGLSFLGWFEIVLPSGFVNRIDRQADKGGWFGIFFMAFTIVLVSFSCTGPIASSILVLAAKGEWTWPVLGMLAYSSAFALPFMLFALFPKALQSMPKSGGWLNTVKVSLGFIELALALKFLSTADQTMHWGLLDREIYLILWIVIFSMLGFYLLGKIRLKSDSEMKHTPLGQLMLSIIVFSFVLYLIPGLWGAPLKALAGYLPPMNTHDFDIHEIVRKEVAPLDPCARQKNNKGAEKPKYGDILHLPHGLNGYFDYAQALRVAKKINKPIFIDFTGHGCVNCREMEAVVWSNPAVLKRLKEDYLVVALYVDDNTRLPESDWITSSSDGKVKKTIGAINADIEVSKFNNLAQPFYILLDPNTEKILVSPVAYDRDVNRFIQFLDSGKRQYRSLYPKK